MKIHKILKLFALINGGWWCPCLHARSIKLVLETSFASICSKDKLEVFFKRA